MEKRSEFDDIRPFYEEEIAAQIAELLKDPEFERVVKIALPNVDWSELKSLLLTFDKRYDFQNTVVKSAVFSVLSRSAKAVDCSGFGNVPKTSSYTFISNHRDIILDASILCVLQLNEGYDTSEICLGDNLLVKPWITSMLRLNKGILVKRGVGTRQQYEVSKQLSEYIHYAIKDKKESVWIAQREGRAKNSDDRTQMSVLKMLGLGGGGHFLENIKAVNIVPLSLSYEFDPCDYLKAKEFQLKRDDPEYKKSQKDDMKNMETGILGYKGNIHFQIGRPINQFLNQIDFKMDKSEQIAQVASIIDNEIFLNYRFYPINYVAYDKLWGNGQFKSAYSEEELRKTEAYFQQKLELIDIPNKDIPFLTEKLLEMYAYPVKNQMETKARLQGECMV